jgi:hypothetical protein
LSQYLHRQVAAREAGFVIGEAGAEVVPFEAVPVQPVDPRTAWIEALAALRFYAPETDTKSLEIPPDWSDLVAQQEPAAALPFCLGNFPQAVRSLHLLLSPDLTNLGSLPARPGPALALLSWAEHTVRQGKHPQTLVAVGVLRLAKQLDAAAELLQRSQANVPDSWRAAWANEEAALAWQRGMPKEALSSWDSQDSSVPALFNRGMAALFTDRPRDASDPLRQAVARIPDTSAWHHLGGLYLTLAQMRS